MGGSDNPGVKGAAIGRAANERGVEGRMRNGDETNTIQPSTARRRLTIRTNETMRKLRQEDRRPKTVRVSCNPSIFPFRKQTKEEPTMGRTEERVDSCGYRHQMGPDKTPGVINDRVSHRAQDSQTDSRSTALCLSDPANRLPYRCGTILETDMEEADMRGEEAAVETDEADIESHLDINGNEMRTNIE